MNISLIPDNESDGDTYANNASALADQFIDVIKTPISKAGVASKTIKGTAWVDTNSNGKKEAEDTLLEGLKVRLWKDGTEITADGKGTLYNVVTDSKG